MVFDIHRKEENPVKPTFFLFNSILLLTLISGCNVNTESQSEDNFIQRLNANDDVLSIENSDLQNETIENDEAQGSTDNIGQEGDVKVLEEDLGHIKPHTNAEKDSDSSPFPLEFSEFKERWNAISSDYSGENFLSSEMVKKEGQASHSAMLNEHLELRVFVSNDDLVERIQIISRENETKKETFTTLSSWWQVLLITNPTADSYEVDLLFSEMGIGPNANTKDITQSTFSYGGIVYKITPTEQGYIFEANYPKQLD
jgi:hypothetical protein